MASQYSLKACELTANCPYCRMSISYTIQKKKRGSKERETPNISKVEYKCIYMSQNTILDANTRPHAKCYLENLSNKHKKK